MKNVLSKKQPKESWYSYINMRHSRFKAKRIHFSDEVGHYIMTKNSFFQEDNWCAPK